MMNKSVLVFLCVLATQLLCAAETKCRIAEIKERVLLGEQIPVTIEVTAGKRGGEIQFEYSGVPKLITMRLLDATGKDVPFRWVAPANEGALWTEFRREYPRPFLRANGTWKFQGDLNELFKIENPGEYRLRVSAATDEEATEVRSVQSAAIHPRPPEDP